MTNLLTANLLTANLLGEETVVILEIYYMVIASHNQNFF